MELKFQNPQNLDFLAPKSKYSRKKNDKKNKFLGVRQRPSGKWVAEIKNTTQKIRMWLGTFDTAEEAARAYDEAAFLLRGSNTRKNFVDHCPPDSRISSKIKSLLNQKKAKNLTFTPTNPSTKKTSPQTTSYDFPVDIYQDFETIYEELPSYNFSFQAPIPVFENNMITSSQINSPQSFSRTTSPTTTDSSNQDFQVFEDDAYKPDLSHCFDVEKTNMGSFQFGQAFEDEFYQLLSTKEEFLVPKNEDHLPEFEHMKVERQISASLYAMNGINEYLENFNNHSDSLWDIQRLSQMFRSS